MNTDLPEFLIAAKRATYAALGDAASVAPALAGSKQLEYRAGRFDYRDVYFGMAYFAGQETVALDGTVVWTMVYAGGIVPEVADGGDVAAIYGFLRQALRLVDARRPFRGPSTFASGDFHYTDESDGDINDFHGREIIRRGAAPIYHLHYGGGVIR